MRLDKLFLGQLPASQAYLGGSLISTGQVLPPTDEGGGDSENQIFPTSFYGVGPGQIPTHWDFRAAAATQSLADSAPYGPTPNLGGAGSMFNLTPGPDPVLYDSTFDASQNNGTTSRMEIDNRVDLVGVHTMFTGYLTKDAATTLGFNKSFKTEIRFIPGNNRVNITSSEGTRSFFGPVPDNQWFVGELICDGSTLDVRINGQSLGQQPLALSPGDLAVDVLFNRASHTVPFNGYCTDALGIILGGDPEVYTTARQYLADKVGITLP